MPEHQILTVLAAFAFAYSLVASRLEKTPVNGALVYVAVGMLFGLHVLDLIAPSVDGEAISRLAEIALIATVLAPTDAALGKAVVTNLAVPAKVRESLNVESGLNDGICAPVILFFIAMAAGSVEASASAGLVIELPLHGDGRRREVSGQRYHCGGGRVDDYVEYRLARADGQSARSEVWGSGRCQ